MGAGDFGELLGPRLGQDAGRTTPDSYAQPEGLFAFVFGSDDPDAETGSDVTSVDTPGGPVAVTIPDNIQVGDFAELSRSVDFTSLTIVRFAVKFRQPASGRKFRLDVKVDAVTLFSLEPDAGDTEEFLQRALRVDAIVGTKVLLFRVEAVA